MSADLWLQTDTLPGIAMVSLESTAAQAVTAASADAGAGVCAAACPAAADARLQAARAAARRTGSAALSTSCSRTQGAGATSEPDKPSGANAAASERAEWPSASPTGRPVLSSSLQVETQSLQLRA